MKSFLPTLILAFSLTMVLPLHPGPEASAQELGAADGYIVEACITLETAAGQKKGFDAQVNDDAGDGRRTAIMKWNDSTNNSWQDLSEAGTLHLVGDKQ